jgi:uncharacterized RDD family membrane protein YckC
LTDSPDSTGGMPTNASLARRFGAIIYDLLLLIALLMLGTLPFVAERGGESVDAGERAYQLVLFGITYLFFVGFWSFRGRTLGMQSWGLQLERMDGGKACTSALTIRFVAAILSWLPAGLGYWWQIWDKQNLTWHDHLSQTKLRYYPRQ